MLLNKSDILFLFNNQLRNLLSDAEYLFFHTKCKMVNLTN